MIGFGEIRRLSAQWQMDLAAVEQLYATAWLLDGIFNQADLSARFFLRGASALRHAYFADYPPTETVELGAREPLAEKQLRDALADAARRAANASQIQFADADIDRGSARFEYVGPLGRRSAAQPRVMLALMTMQTRAPLTRAVLLKRFSDARETSAPAIAVEEFAAERIAALGQSPRARDVYDLWFVLTHEFDSARVRALAQQIAAEKKIALPRADAPFAPAHRAILERAWEKALQSVLDHPSLTQVENDLLLLLKGMRIS